MSGYSTLISHPADSSAVIVLMGATGTGKSTFINLMSCSDMVIGNGLQSCTDKVQVAGSFELDGHLVSLVDTPGFDDSEKSDFEILNMITKYLSDQYRDGTKLAGIIYMHRISDVRFSGMSAKNFRMFRHLCGEDSLKNVVIVTNRWGDVTEILGEAREVELKETFFKPVLDKNGKMLRHLNTLDSGRTIVRSVLKNQPEALQIQVEMIDQEKDISETTAGYELNRELQKMMEKHTKDMNELRIEMEEATRMQDEETRRALADEAQKLLLQLEQVENDTKMLTSDDEKAAREKERRDMEDKKQPSAKSVVDFDRDSTAAPVAPCKLGVEPVEPINGMATRYDKGETNETRPEEKIGKATRLGGSKVWFGFSWIGNCIRALG